MDWTRTNSAVLVESIVCSCERNFRLSGFSMERKGIPKLWTHISFHQLLHLLFRVFLEHHSQGHLLCAFRSQPLVSGFARREDLVEKQIPFSSIDEAETVIFRLWNKASLLRYVLKMGGTRSSSHSRLIGGPSFFKRRVHGQVSEQTCHFICKGL